MDEVFVADSITNVMITMEQFNMIIEYLNYLTGFALFFAVIIICYLGYKFWNLFF